MIATMHSLMPDLRVEIKDVIADADKVVVRNLWSGSAAETGQRVQLRGFVLLRLANGKIAERWATVMPLH